MRNASSRGCCGLGMTKSMMLVVPPARPAAVPVKKSSAATVPMNGSCMWVCGSMPPGRTYWPPASSFCALAGALFAASSPTAAMRPSRHSTSALNSRSALTTVPPRMRREGVMLRSLRLWRFHPAAHAEEIDHRGDGEAHERGVGVDAFEESPPIRKALGEGRVQEPRHIGEHPQHERDDGDPVPSRAVAVGAGFVVKGVDVELLLPDEVIVDDQDARHGAKERRIADEPREDVALRRLQHFPRHHEDGDDGGDDAARGIGDAARVERPANVGP